jgi:hypothetical protein
MTLDDEADDCFESAYGATVSTQTAPDEKSIDFLGAEIMDAEKPMQIMPGVNLPPFLRTL